MDTPVAGPRGGCPFCEDVEEVAEAAPGDVLRDDTYMRLRKEEEGRKKEEEGGGRRRKKEEEGRRRKKEEEGGGRRRKKENGVNTHILTYRTVRVCGLRYLRPTFCGLHARARIS